MKYSILLALLIFNVTLAVCQDNDGNLCGHEGERQLWLLRFEIIDSETHLPVRNAVIEISGDNGNDMTWEASNRGTSVLVVTSEYCIPSQGKLEVKARNYNYYQEDISRRFFQNEESNNRIYIPGKYNFDKIPNTQELMDIITAKRYRKGVRNIQIMGGVDVQNNSPACFEYTIEMQKIDRDFGYNDDSRNRYSNRGNSQANLINGWERLPTNEFNQTHYKKGDTELILEDNGDGSYIVTKGKIGADTAYYIDFNGNTTRYRTYTKSEAMRIINNYISNH